MKGTIKETPSGWFVWYQVMRDGVTSGYDSIPLHPGNLDEIWDGKVIEFEIVKENVDTGALEAPYIKVKYAKLIDRDYQTKPGFVERRMALGKHNNDKLWDEIYSEYSKEQYPPFGGPWTTDALSFIDWLKQYYIVPERI